MQPTDTRNVTDMFSCALEAYLLTYLLILLCRAADTVLNETSDYVNRRYQGLQENEKMEKLFNVTSSVVFLIRDQIVFACFTLIGVQCTATSMSVCLSVRSRKRGVSKTRSSAMAEGLRDALVSID